MMTKERKKRIIRSLQDVGARLQAVKMFLLIYDLRFCSFSSCAYIRAFIIFLLVNLKRRTELLFTLIISFFLFVAGSELTLNHM